MSTAKPTALKILQGNPGKRALNFNEPIPDSGAPDCPDYVKGAAKREWTRVCRELEHMKILASIDRAMLVAYCLAWGTYDDANRDIARNGLIFKLENGYESVRPIVKIRDQAEKRLLTLCREFGFSPASRSKVKVPPKGQQADAMTALLANRN